MHQEPGNPQPPSPPSDASRRDFLTGRAATQAIAAKLPSDVSSVAGGYVLTLARRAMACEFEIRIPASRQDAATAAAMAALDMVEAVESRLTIYRDDSEVSELNRTAASRPARVSLEVFGLLELAAQLHRDSAGAYDISSTPLSDAWGFSRRQGKLPEPTALADALARTGWQHVRLDAVRSTVAFSVPGMRVNFNSMGKGHALDRAAAVLADANIGSYAMHGGSSTIVARGNAPSRESGWGVAIHHPFRPGVLLAEANVADRALSTSGSGTQYFRHRGRRYGHLLDPRTGQPAEGVDLVTVLAPTGAEADALSTAFYVVGPEGTEQYCRSHPHVAALMVLPTGREGDCEIVCFGSGDSFSLR